jgi:CheY-like chemotaxis protein
MARVIVIDDEDVLLEMMATLIEEAGHYAMTASSGKEALALLRAEDEPPALIILDVMMPQLNGAELTQVIKNNPQFCDIPVVLMSAAGRPPDGHAADAFLNKPFDVDVLEALIEDILTTRHNRNHRCSDSGLG